jgi:hypothetical protein
MVRMPPLTSLKPSPTCCAASRYWRLPLARVSAPSRSWPSARRSWLSRSSRPRPCPAPWPSAAR